MRADPRTEDQALRAQVVELTSALVAIDSVNPSLVEGGAGENEIARFVERWALAAGLEAELVEETPGRPSTIVRARGSGGGQTLLLCGHLDTVGVGGMVDPFLPRVDGDRLFGRGAYDMKAGLAAALVACREAGRLALAGEVVVAAVADEEHSSIGIEEVLRTVRADLAIVTEPTELELVIAHKGFVWIELEVTGRAAHGSRPQLGLDAIVAAGPILTALGELETALGARTHPLLGRGSIHASLIEGGTELSSYPPWCRVSVERRTLPGETTESVEAELDRLLDACRRANPSLAVERRTLLARDPLEAPPDSRHIATIVDAAAEIGLTPSTVGAGYWADSGLIAAAGIPTVLFGPSGEGAHAREEWVSIPDTETTARTLLGVARRVCA